MKNALLRSLLLTAIATLVGGEANAYSSPRLTDGTTPDLRGLWQVRDTAYVNIEGHAGGSGIAAAKSIIVDPTNGKIPYRSDSLAKRNENFRNRSSTDPAGKCYQAGVPRAAYLPTPLQIVQSPGNFALVYQDSHSYRIVYPQSRAHFEGVDWWMGDSRGHWEGDTFVVDVTTQIDQTWLDAAGNHHSGDIHVIERYTRTGEDTLQYEARIEDAKIYTKPWTLRTTLYRQTGPGARILEDECLDDENHARHRISPQDQRSLLHNNYRRWRLAADAGLVTLPPAPMAAAVVATAKPVVAANIPRLSNSRPDFQGNWYKKTGMDIPGGGGFGPGNADRDTTIKRGMKIPYLPEAALEANWRKANQYLDGEPRCHLAGVPRAAEQPPYPHFIIQDDKYLTILYEYVREPRVIPLDGSAHPKNYWAWDGDSRAHWEGDTLVVDVSNVNGRTWLDMDGNFADENLHVVERYTMIDANTYLYEATLTDPTVFAHPWSFTFEVKRQPNADQILEYSCLEGEGDLANYADVINQKRVSGQASTDIVRACLRGSLVNKSFVYSVDTVVQGKVKSAKLAVDEATSKKLPELIDREVLLRGQWRENKSQFSAEGVRVVAEGCSATGK